MSPSLLFYRFARGLVVLFCKAFWRVSVEGAEHVPTTEPFVLAPVHRSNVDTLLVAAVTRRRLHYMGKDSMWKYKIPGWLFSALGAFPVRRGSADREALRRCLDELAKGEPVVMFPEGTRQSGSVVQPLFDGPAYVAARAGVPIVPVGIGGSEQAMPKGSKLVKPVKVHLVVGPPLRARAVPDGGRVARAAVRELSDELHAEVQRLFDAAQACVS